MTFTKEELKKQKLEDEYWQELEAKHFCEIENGQGKNEEA